MNKYLKNAGLALFVTGISSSLSAQTRYTDLEVVGISPAGEIKNGARLPLIFKIMNHGPDDEIAGDTIFYRLYQVQDGIVREVYTGMLGGAANPAGESSSYRDNYSINSFDFPDLKEPVTVDFCFELFTQALLPNGDTLILSRLDTNYSNNVNCTKVTVVPRSTGIQDARAMEKKISIYPNPADKIIVLQRDDKTYTDELNITICDFSGRTLLKHQFKEAELQSGTLSLNVAQLPIGVYIVHLQTEAASVTQRLVITR